MLELEDLLPDAGHEVIVEQNDGVDLHRDQITRRGFLEAGFARQYLFRNGHAHDNFLLAADKPAFKIIEEDHAGNSLRRRRSRANAESLFTDIGLDTLLVTLDILAAAPRGPYLTFDHDCRDSRLSIGAPMTLGRILLHNCS
jgi:hypothetical protein